MPVTHHRAKDHLAQILEHRPSETLLQQLRPKFSEPAPPPISSRFETNLDAGAVARRWRSLPLDAAQLNSLLDPHTRQTMAQYRRNIENFIGTVKVPVGVAGPLRVNGLFAHGDYPLPLATTEAALVASYHRGAQLISQAGGCTAALLSQAVNRTPAFAFQTLAEAGQFAAWAIEQLEQFRQQAATTTRHGRLIGMQLTIEGNHVYLNFEFTTGDAAGQNMVTIATQAICNYIQRHAPIKPRYYFLEANMSGDKKASARSFLSVRGKKVSAEVTLPAPLLEQRLHTTPKKMVEYWRMAAIGGVLSGTMGVQGHYANGLAALYLACGQDVACVSESAVGVTRFELTAQGDLYAAVTLPNLMVGTVGGGTGLASQRACLELMGLYGTGHAAALAEVCAGLCLAGELSIAGAMCAGDFTRAHQHLARGSTPEQSDA